MFHPMQSADIKAVSANASDEPLYEARFGAQRVSVPVRPRLMDAQGRLVVESRAKLSH